MDAAQISLHPVGIKFVRYIQETVVMNCISRYSHLKARLVLRRCALPLGTLAVGGIALGAFSGCGSPQVKEAAEAAARQALKKDAQEAKASIRQLGDVVSTGAILSGHDAKGRKLWSVGAAKISAHEEKLGIGDKVLEPRRAELTDARATLYREGKAHSTFRSPRLNLVYADRGVMMTMTGGVKMRTPGTWDTKKQKKLQPLTSRGAIELVTPQVNVDVKAREVRADKGVVMTQGKTRVAARQLFADTELATARLTGAIKASAPEGTMNADRAAWNWRDGRAVAQGKITIAHDGTTLSGTRLDADTDGSRGELSGGVRAVSAEGKASAGRVLYNWKENTLSARQDVTLQKEDGTLRAARIDTDDKLRRATASGGVTLVKGDATLRASQIVAFDKLERAMASGEVVLTRPDATMRAARAEVWIDEKRAVGNGVTVVRGDVNVRADRAEVFDAQNKKTARIVASGGVVAQNPQGTVRAANVVWGGGRVTGSGGVTLVKDGNTIRGSRLTSDDKFKEATLSGDVNGRLARGGTVSAGVVLLRNGMVLARGGVSGRRDDLRLRADTLEATRDGQHATLRGNVVVTSDDGVTARAPVVRYDKKAAKVYASGGVTVVDPKHGQQRGRTLVADLKLNNAVLTEVSGTFSEKLFKDRKLF
jgi:lipopolysaccharide assembly outer membrane protein LptD (OstA)